MTEILFHASQREAAELASQLRATLEGIENNGIPALISRIPGPIGERPRLVFTGQYNAGKSTLIKALTGRDDVVIDSDIATAVATDYDWDGLVTLVDTPGVQTGRPDHDTIASNAIVGADLILFAFTVELFDEAGLRHLRHIVNDLGRGDQTLLVLTKVNTLRAQPGAREEAIAEALGPLASLPIVACDAGDFLHGMGLGDADRGRQYMEYSKVDEVRHAINDLSRRAGDLARLKQPLQAIKALATEAEAFLADDPKEASALILLARQRKALTERRQRIEIQIRTAETNFRAQAIRVAEAFNDRVERIDDVPDGEERMASLAPIVQSLREDLNIAATAFGEELKLALRQQFDDLASEVAQIEASPHRTVVLELAAELGITPASAGDVDADVIWARGKISSNADGHSWIGEVAGMLTEFQKRWGAGAGDGLKASSQTTGHKIVLIVGHRFNKSFRPWEAIKIADRIGTVARVGGAALSFGAAAIDVAATERRENAVERARQQRRNAVVLEVTQQADNIARAATTPVREEIDGSFNESYKALDAARNGIIGTQRQRSTSVQELAEIIRRADAALARLSGAPDERDSDTPRA